MEFEVIPAIKDIGMGFNPWSPLAEVCGGTSQKAETGAGRCPTNSRIQLHYETLNKFKQLSSELNAKPSQVALAWLLHKDYVTAPIIGPRNSVQLEDNIQSMEIKLSTEVLDRLDNLWPGPGEAPDCYTNWGSPR